MANKQIQRVLFPSPQTSGQKTRCTVLGPKEEVRTLRQRAITSPGKKRRRTDVALASIPLKDICDSSPVPLPIAAAAAVSSANAGSGKILDPVVGLESVAVEMNSAEGVLRGVYAEGLRRPQSNPSTPVRQKRVTFSDAVEIREEYPKLSKQAQSRVCAEAQTNLGADCENESFPRGTEVGSHPQKTKENASTLAQNASPVSPANENLRLTSGAHIQFSQETGSLQQDGKDSCFMNDGLRDSQRLNPYQEGYGPVQRTPEHEREQNAMETTPTKFPVKDSEAKTDSPILPEEDDSVCDEAESIKPVERIPRKGSNQKGMDGKKYRLRKRNIKKGESNHHDHGIAGLKRRPRQSEVLRLQKSLETAFWTDSRKVRNLSKPIVLSDHDEPSGSGVTRISTPGKKKAPMRRSNTERHNQPQLTRSIQKRKKKSSVIKRSPSLARGVIENEAKAQTGPLTRSRMLNTKQLPSFVEARDRRQRPSQRTMGNKLKRSLKTQAANKNRTHSSREGNEAVGDQASSSASSESRHSVLMSPEDVTMQVPENQETKRAIVIRKRSKRKSSNPKHFRATPNREHVRQLSFESEEKSFDTRLASPRPATIGTSGHDAQETSSTQNCFRDKVKKDVTFSAVRELKEQSYGNRVIETDVEVMDSVKLSAAEWTNFQIGWDLHYDITNAGSQIDLSKVLEYIRSPFGFGNSFDLVL